MLARARHEAQMRAPVDGGPESTRAQLLKLVERGGDGVARKQLTPPGLPGHLEYLGPTWDAIQYLWDWFLELDRSRSFNGMSGRPDPITYPVLDAWARLTGRELLPHEVDALQRLDAAYLGAVAGCAHQATAGAH